MIKQAWNRTRRLVRDSQLASAVVCRFYRFLDLLISPAVLVALFEPLFALTGRRAPGEFNKKQIRKILVLRTERIGDLVLSTPLLRELRSEFPDAHIALFIHPSLVNMLELCPYVDELITFDKGCWNRKWRWHGFLFALPVAINLWSRRFDLAVKPSWNVDRDYSSAIAYLSGARWRLGYTESMQKEKARFNKGYDRFFTHPIEAPCEKHEVEHNLYALEKLSCLMQPISAATPRSTNAELWLDEHDQSFARELIASLRSQQLRSASGAGPLVAFCTSASMDRKKWPLERYSKIARWMVEKYDALIVVVGGTSDREDGDRLAEAAPGSIFNLAGRTTLRQCSAVLKQCQMYVGNDTGPMHVAAAFGVPVVAIFAYPASAQQYQNSCPRRFKPWQTQTRTIQPRIALDSCGTTIFGSCLQLEAHCILQITTEEVMVAVSTIMPERAQAAMPTAITDFAYR